MVSIAQFRIRAKQTQVKIFSFKIKPLQQPGISGFAKFWEAVFRRFEIVSIHLNSKKLMLYITRKSNDFNNVNIQMEVQEMKSSIYKFLPLQSDCIFVADFFPHEIPKEKCYFHFDFINLSIPRSFNPALNGLLNFPDCTLIISKETADKRNHYYLSIRFPYDGTRNSRDIKDRLLHFLKMNPFVEGKISRERIKYFKSGREFLGLSKRNILKTNAMKILASFSEYQQSVATVRNEKIEVYPWLGFVLPSSHHIPFQEVTDTSSKSIIKDMIISFKEKFSIFEFTQSAYNYLSFKHFGIMVSFIFLNEFNDIEILSTKNIQENISNIFFFVCKSADPSVTDSNLIILEE